MKKRTIIILILVFMCIVFAAGSVTFLVLGKSIVSENENDYDVIFTSAILDNEDVYDSVVSSDKRTLTFSTKDLTEKGDTSILSYSVTNKSNNYDANVYIDCTPLTSEYTFLKNEFTAEDNIIKSMRNESGKITITVKKMPMEIVHEEYKCELVASPIERDELGYSGPTEWTFDFTGSEQVFTAPVSGDYMLETWGAQGGSVTYSSTTYRGGYGGYSKGVINLDFNDLLYINTGGAGSGGVSSGKHSGGYNGGGAITKTNGTDHYYASGGGATHIALSSGLLTTFENNYNDLLIVSGGGGGGFRHTSSSKYSSIGGDGGGITGTDATIAESSGKQGLGGSQTAGGKYDGSTETSSTIFGSFGLGGTPGNSWGSAGGGGFYGGGASYGNTLNKGNSGGGGGSGYIGNSLLKEKSMYCYNCTESTEESTKTVSTTCSNETATENCAKAGNGFVRITLLDY